MKTVLIILLTILVLIALTLVIKTWKIKATLDEKYLTIKLFNFTVKRIPTPRIIQGLVAYKDDSTAKKVSLGIKDVIPHMEVKSIIIELADYNVLMVEEIIFYGIICQYNQLCAEGKITGPEIRFTRKRGDLSFKARINLTVNGSIIIYHYLKTRRSKTWKTSAH